MKSVQDVKLLMVGGVENDLSNIFQDFDVNSFDRNGDNILHHYILSTSYNPTNFNPEIFIKELIKRGLDLNAVQSELPNRSALHLAVITNNKRITELLISLKAKIDIRDNYGNSPLWLAVMNYRNDDPFFIQFLISNGADKNIENESGISPLKLANTIANYNAKHLLQ
jgi:uncharacterized protein